MIESTILQSGIGNMLGKLKQKGRYRVGVYDFFSPETKLTTRYFNTRKGLADFLRNASDKLEFYEVARFAFDLSGQDLTGIRLPDMQMLGWNFEGAILKNADLQETLLSGVNFKNADLSGANLHEAYFGFAIHSSPGTKQSPGDKERHLPAAIMENTIFNRTYLVKANLADCQIRNADFRGANLWNADARDAVISGCDFTGASLHETLLKGAELVNSTVPREVLREAVCEGLKFHPATSPRRLQALRRKHQPGR